MKPAAKRLGWVDIYKGIAICLIVIGHTWSPLTRFVYLFHVPAFFLISGYTTNFVRDSFATFFRRRLRSLLLPYLAIGTMLIGFYTVVRICLGRTNILQADVFHPVGAVKDFVLTGLPPIDLSGATWFLIVMFFASIGLKLVYDLTAEMRRAELARFAIVIIAVCYSLILYHYHMLLPYNLDLVPIAALFMQLGVTTKKYALFERVRPLPALALSLTVLAIGTFVHFFPEDWPSRQFAPLPYLIITALAGSYLLYLVSKLVEASRLNRSFEYIGRNSLAILAFHFLMFKPVYLVLAAFAVVPRAQVSTLVPLNHMNHYWWLLSLVSISLSLALAWYINLSPRLAGIIFGRSEPVRLPRWVGRRSKTYAIGTLIVALILVAVTVSQRWILSPHFSFYFDDYDWLATAATQSYGQLLRLIPRQTYNDRPVGAAAIKLLYDAFGLHPLAHHSVLFAFHLLNGLLVYAFVERLMRVVTAGSQKRTIATVSAIIFVGWPVSTLFVGWDAAIFDTLATFLLLLGLYGYLSWRSATTYHWARGIALAVVYLAAIRTKEMAVTLPVLWLLIEVAIARYGTKLHDLHRSIAWPVVVPSLIVLPTYLVSLIHANSVHPQHYAPDSPYYLRHNPVAALHNLYRYCMLYLDPTIANNSYLPGTGHIGLVLAALVLIVILAGVAIVTRRLPLLALGLVLFATALSPVLFLANVTQRLYLYFPSVFGALIMGYSAVALLRLLPARPIVQTQIAVVAILIMVSGANQLAPVRLTKAFYVDTIGRENERVLSSITALPRPERGKHILIANVSPLSQLVFPFMERYGTIRPYIALTKDPTLTGTVRPEITTLDEARAVCPDCYIVDYNGGDLKLLSSR